MASIFHPRRTTKHSVNICWSNCKADRGPFAAVLIDEAQDWPSKLFQCAKFALREPETGDLLIVGDGSHRRAHRNPAARWYRDQWTPATHQASDVAILYPWQQPDAATSDVLSQAVGRPYTSVVNWIA